MLMFTLHVFVVLHDAAADVTDIVMRCFPAFRFIFLNRI